MSKWIFYVSIFTLFACGVGAGFGLTVLYGGNNFEGPSSEIIPENPIVSIAEGANDYWIDTVPGVMFVNYNIPEVLPLCLSEEYINANFDITVVSYGGYHPDDAGVNEMYICQPKTEMGGIVMIDWDETSFICQDPEKPCYGCEVYKYEAVFTLPDGPIQLDSNHLPTIIADGADCEWWCDGTPSPNLNKWVCVSVVTSWEGCHEIDQKFTLIWIHY